jgi:CheY-like chemotaxis protein/HPt (histidine-containing phosphotransfer) domain-containing protein
MGGSISVKSETEVGSRFRLTLPDGTPALRESAAEAQAPRVLPVPVLVPLAAATPPQLSILLVEDEPVNQEVARALLGAFGHSLEVAENGAVAIRRAAERAYDLVLMDMQMPVMDGLVAARALRKMASYREVPIIAMTANAFAEDRARCLQAGMNDFITKPVEPAILQALIERWARLCKVQPSAVATAVPSGRPPAGKAASAVPAAGFDRIDGLDLNAGLESVNGDHGTFLNMLRIYLEMHRNDVAGLRACLEHGDADAAARIAHTVKGAAAAIGAFQVVEQAARMATLLHNPARDPAYLTQAMAALDAANTSLVEALEARLA